MRTNPLRAGVTVLWLLSVCCGVQAVAKSPSTRFENEIQAFEKADKVKPPQPGGIVFTGSSTIRMWTTLAADFSDQQVLNRGFGGCEVADCVYFADRVVVAYKPRLVVLRAGTNDINAGKSPEQVAEDFKAFVAKVRTGLQKVRIAYMAINATPSRWKNVEREKKANALIKEFIDSGKAADLVYIDAFDVAMNAQGSPRDDLFIKDRLHFNAEGYKLLAERVRPFLK